MKPSRVRRHLWHVDDACCVCGVKRDGYQGGRTGSLRYTWPDGRVTTSAGECPGAPKTELLDDDGVWVDTGVPATIKSRSGA
jgi:hypothetical protein